MCLGGTVGGIILSWPLYLLAGKGLRLPAALQRGECCFLTLLKDWRLRSVIHSTSAENTMCPFPVSPWAAQMQKRLDVNAFT